MTQPAASAGAAKGRPAHPVFATADYFTAQITAAKGSGGVAQCQHCFTPMGRSVETCCRHILHHCPNVPADKRQQLREILQRRGKTADLKALQPPATASRACRAVNRGQRSGAVISLQQFVADLAQDTQAAGDSFGEHGGHTDQALASAAHHAQQWDALAKQFVADACACGWCGRVALGGRYSQLRAQFHMRDSSCTPPAVLANPLLLDLARVPAAR